MKDMNQGIAVLKKYAQKAKLVAIGVASFFATQQAIATNKGTPENKKTDETEEFYKDNLNVKTAKDVFASFDVGNEKKEIKIGGVYKGIYMDFTKMEAPDIGHLFESGMNPYIMGDGKYLGLYQMETGTTMKSFIFGTSTQDGEYDFAGVAQDYPELAKLGETVKGRRSPEFVKMFGGLSKTKKFRHKMDNFMQVALYDKVFNKLRQIEGLDIDNRGEAFRGSVMSAINQNHDPMVINSIFNTAFNSAKAVARKENHEVLTEDIIKFSYDIRRSKWKRVATRYTEENRLCQDFLAFEKAVNERKMAEVKRDKYIKEASKALNVPNKGRLLAANMTIERDALTFVTKQAMNEAAKATIVKDAKATANGKAKSTKTTQKQSDINKVILMKKGQNGR